MPDTKAEDQEGRLRKEQKSSAGGTTMDKVSVYGTQMGNNRESRDRVTAKAGSARNKNRGLAAMRTEKKKRSGTGVEAGMCGTVCGVGFLTGDKRDLWCSAGVILCTHGAPSIRGGADRDRLRFRKRAQLGVVVWVNFFIVAGEIGVVVKYFRIGGSACVWRKLVDVLDCSGVCLCVLGCNIGLSHHRYTSGALSQSSSHNETPG